MASTDLLTPDDAAEILGIDPSLVRKYCREGRIEATKPSRDWVMTRAAVKRFAKIPRERGNPDWKNGE